MIEAKEFEKSKEAKGSNFLFLEHWCIRRNIILTKVWGQNPQFVNCFTQAFSYKLYPELHVTILYLTVVEDLSGWPQHFPGNPSPLSAHLQPAFSQMRKVF